MHGVILFHHSEREREKKLIVLTDYVLLFVREEIKEQNCSFGAVYMAMYRIMNQRERDHRSFCNLEIEA
jgi:hypothetical protein